jgi:hypothetical protein
MSQDQNPKRFKGRKRVNVSPEEATRLFQTPPQKQNKKQNISHSPGMARPAGVEPPEQVCINNLVDLYELIEKLKPENSVNDAKPIVYDSKNTSFADEKFNGHITIPQSGGDSTIRQSILEGFEMIRNHQKCYEAQLTAHESPEDFGGYMPARVPDPENQITWLDGFIIRRLGGKREGLLVVWDLVEGRYQMDPWTCEVKLIDA